MGRNQPAAKGPSTARSQAHCSTPALQGFRKLPFRPLLVPFLDARAKGPRTTGRFGSAPGSGVPRRCRHTDLPRRPGKPHGRTPLPPPRTAVRHKTRRSPPGASCGRGHSSAGRGLPVGPRPLPRAHTHAHTHTHTRARAVGRSPHADSAEPRGVPRAPAGGPSAAVRAGAARDRGERRSPHGNPEAPAGRPAGRPVPAALPGPTRSHLPRHLGRRHRCEPATGPAPPGRAGGSGRAHRAASRGGEAASSLHAASPARAATPRRSAAAFLPGAAVPGGAIALRQARGYGHPPRPLAVVRTGLRAGPGGGQRRLGNAVRADEGRGVDAPRAGF